MKKHERVIRHGPLKGKRITFASTERIETLKGIAEEFMSRVFELEPGDYLISDESDLRTPVPNATQCLHEEGRRTLPTRRPLTDYDRDQRPGSNARVKGAVGVPFTHASRYWNRLSRKADR